MNFISIDDHQLHYRTFGNGPHILCSFHGSGQNSEAYQLLGEALGREYRIYSFDLFFHGESHWATPEQPIRHFDLASFFELFLLENDIREFSLMGYSLGARFALSIFQSFPRRVQKLYLIAPEGIRRDPWYEFATFPGLPRRVFRELVDHPLWFDKLVGGMSKIGLLNRKYAQFLNNMMNTREKRERIVQSWICFRGLMPELDKILPHISESKPQILIFLGKYDRMVRKSHLQKFISKIPQYELIEFPVTHGELIPEVTQYLIEENKAFT